MADPGHSQLPIEAVLPVLTQALESGNRVLLQAEPGVGKTTRAPVALLDATWCTGKILVLEPRRLAARAAASHVAKQLGEQPGGLVGYRVRLDSKISERTRIEFLTEGIFCRMISADPELQGVSAVIFDEFHERNLDGDLGLALALDSQAGLRNDLRLIIMSATLATESLSQVLDPIAQIDCPGRTYPVSLEYLPRDGRQAVPETMAKAILRTISRKNGSLLCFLPGIGEINQTRNRILDLLPPDIDLHVLHGSMEPGQQDKAIRPAPPGRRKVVLATSIAESSLTIEGVTVVIDSGLRRAPRHDPRTGLTRLETVRAARSSVEQRAGRAGRTQPGLAIRLWAEAQTTSLGEQEPPEILASDLSGLVLSLADWGLSDPRRLTWITPPPEPAWREALSRLQELGAIGPDGTITSHGRNLSGLPMIPQLAHMVILAARSGQAFHAAMLALLLTERGLGGTSTDIGERLDRLQSDNSPRGRSLRSLARRLATEIPAENEAPLSNGGLLSLAFPDRIARARGRDGHFLLANGSGARLDETDRMAGARYVVAADLAGAANAARIVSGAVIEADEIRRLHGHRFERRRELHFDEASGIFRVIVRQKLGALAMQEEPAPIEDGDRIDLAILDLIEKRGLSILPWNESCETLRGRLDFLHSLDPQAWPDMRPEVLAKETDQWLLPFLGSIRGPGEIRPDTLREGLRHRAREHGADPRELDRLAPDFLQLENGSRLPVDYSGELPCASVRVQELYGTTTHPAVGENRIPVVLELLSPAMRPIQLTRDLPGFWNGSWAEVRREMRGRYPKHDWPEHPAHARPGRGPARKRRD